MAIATEPGRRRRSLVVGAVLITATVGALAMLVAAFVMMARHPDTGTQAAPPSAPVPTATTTPTTSALTAAMWDWELRAGDHFKESARALQHVSEAVDRGDDAGVRAGCQQLHDTNAVGLQADLPTPDPVLTAELQRMIDDVNVATHACLRFTDTRHADDATTYQIYLARAMDHLATAKRILNEDLGKG
ncbi:hypothetical protein B1R94_26860 [Mycolicibacterium litorale]|nr:hypothetical protein B1R94_26860 [Mycolicibacterium litorale]